MGHSSLRLIRHGSHLTDLGKILKNLKIAFTFPTAPGGVEERLTVAGGDKLPKIASKFAATRPKLGK